ncbi:hypothetical protein [Spartinivicinus poritis]|uniref:Uncharacterized protein n=1 Tax=Spartinivicinus poritis TaxID=2994640 RepID=A0ABT5U613_9GAMM|nr:hypothetical protein [Spartinivicinus sp. A2-2]MDE1461795.1 hypothetical protein [Spartinivicinus sp. A2-2]
MLDIYQLEDKYQQRLDIFLYEYLKSSSDYFQIAELRQYFQNNSVDFERLPNWSILRLLNHQENDCCIDMQAIRNLVEYFYEPIFLKGLNKQHQFSYLSSIEKNVYIQIDQELIDKSTPILLETFHHRWIFSLIPMLISMVAKQLGIKKAVLLRRHTEVEHRLECIRTYLGEIHQVEVVLIAFEDNWYRNLIEEITDDTIVVYFGDMSPALFPKKSKLADTDRYLMLTDATSDSYLVRAFSFADKLANRLKLSHALLNHYQSNHFVLHLSQQQNIFSCPAIDWMFWPALELFSKEKYPIKTANAI